MVHARTDEELRERIIRSYNNMGIKLGPGDRIFKAFGEELTAIAHGHGIPRTNDPGYWTASHQDHTSTRDPGVWKRNVEYVEITRTSPGSNDSCSHDLKLYQGLTEVFKYCTKCDHKEEVAK